MRRAGRRRRGVRLRGIQEGTMAIEISAGRGKAPRARSDVAYYNAETINRLWHTIDLSAMMTVRALPRVYRSLWRTLHVDGFEAGSIQFQCGCGGLILAPDARS